LSSGSKQVPQDPEEAFQLALKRSLERLRRSDCLASEVQSLLQRNGFAQATVERVVADLQERRLLNDSKTINSLVASKTGKRAAGIEKMRHELRQRGAPEKLIENRLEEVTPESQTKGMRELLKARCKPTDSRAKGARLLLSRGFDEDAITSVLDEFFGVADFPE
jgi:regulatory protein